MRVCLLSSNKGDIVEDKGFLIHKAIRYAWQTSRQQWRLFITVALTFLGVQCVLALGAIPFISLVYRFGDSPLIAIFVLLLLGYLLFAFFPALLLVGILFGLGLCVPMIMLARVSAYKQLSGSSQ